MSRPDSRGGLKYYPTRKVRAPQGRITANGRRGNPRESATEIYRRKRLAYGLERALAHGPLAVRVERRGKSSPARWRQRGPANPIRSNADRSDTLARCAPKGGLSRLATGGLDRWLLTTELGLQAHSSVYEKTPPTSAVFFRYFVFALLTVDQPE